MVERISDDELRRLLTVSEGSDYPLAFRAAGQLIALAPALADEVLQLREALTDIMADRPSEKHNGNRNDLIAWQMWRRARRALSDTMKQEGRK